MTQVKAKTKWLLLAAAAVVIALAMTLVGCSSNSSSTESSSSTSATKLIVGLDNSYPPYGFIGEDGELTGFDIDLAKAVCEKNGWDLELEAIDWDTKDALIQSGQINCIWNGFTIQGREDDYAWSDAYMRNAQVVVVKQGSDISSLADLAGKTVITQQGSSTEELFEGDQKELADTFGSLEKIADFNNAFLQLDSGLVDAVACDLAVAQYNLAQSGDKYVQLTEELSSETYGIAFKKGSDGEEMAKTVTDTLTQLYKDGEVKTIAEKYTEYGLSYENWLLK